jgi:glycosyltransferase involved in cell wall biosynthesis
MINSFDASITVGQKDYEFLKTLSPRANVALIPNGVDTDCFYPIEKEKSGYPIMIFSGNMKFLPNIDAVLYFYNDIFPLVRSKIPNIRLYIVGASPPEKIKRLSNDENVVVTGYVDDIRTFIAKADVVICPMRMGAGIKNKILEAMAMGKAVISTLIGAEGIDAINRENILISNSPGDFVENIIAILSNDELRNKITKNARKLINENYTWDICSRRYEELYTNQLGTAKNTKR